MPSTEGRSNSISDLFLQSWCEFLAVTHFQEQQNTFVLVMDTPLTNAKRVVEERGELLEYRVDFSRSKADPTRIENPIAVKERLRSQDSDR